MVIFITSSPCLEGESRISTKNNFLNELLRTVEPASRGLFITADPDNYGYSDYCASSMRHSLEISGLSFSSFELLDRRNMAQAAALVTGSDFIILGGGHVPTQNRFFHDLGLKELLATFSGVIMGISAGSMNLAGTVYAMPEEPGESAPGYCKFLPGLGLTDVNICPHLQKVRHNYVDNCRLFEDIIFPDSRGHKFYALPDGSYILQENGQKILRGEAYLIEKGLMMPRCMENREIILP